MYQERSRKQSFSAAPASLRPTTAGRLHREPFGRRVEPRHGSADSDWARTKTSMTLARPLADSLDWPKRKNSQSTPAGSRATDPIFAAARQPVPVFLLPFIVPWAR